MHDSAGDDAHSECAMSELAAEEIQLLLGLLLMLVNADDQYSPEESKALKTVADEIGRDVFIDHAVAAHRRFGSQVDLLMAAQGLQRPAARRLIFSLASDLAMKDGLVAEEAELLAYLAEIWQIDWH